ncbi:MAG: helix-turn-helix domain-containing protein [Oscillospiraceae bacterium]|nr:helix-turn-helix domain-containing protein [Oscillospiraceae bacterium]
MDNHESQCFIILCHLKSKGSITKKEARGICQCERLEARIHDLRKKGFPISTEMKTYINKHGNLVRYAEYRLEDSKC